MQKDRDGGFDNGKENCEPALKGEYVEGKKEPTILRCKELVKYVGYRNSHEVHSKLETVAAKIVSNVLA